MRNFSNSTRRLLFEELEERRLLAIDVLNLNNSGPGSLREAVNTANNSNQPEEINIVMVHPDIEFRAHESKQVKVD